MRISKWVSVETEVEIDLGTDDINLIFTDAGDYANPNLTHILGTNITRAIQFLEGIPADLIAAQTPEFRAVVAQALNKTALKFEEAQP